MDLKIMRAKSFNLMLLFLIAVLLILLIMTSMLFLSSSVDGAIEPSSIISASFLILFCLPITIILYMNSNEKISKKIFLALALTFFFLSLSGIVWYLLPDTFNWLFFIPVGMLLMIISYIPISSTLLYYYIQQRNKLHKIVKTFIYYVIVAFFILLLFFDVTYISRGKDPLYVLVYSASIFFDALIVGLTVMLILINMPTQLRYLLSIIFGFDSINFIGDSFNLIKYLNIYDISINPNYFYDATLIFASGTLLIYALSNIKIMTIEEVNKKLKDTSLVVEDLIMQSPNPMCISDIKGSIIKANQLFSQMFNVKVNDNIFNINLNNNSTSIEDVKEGKTVHIDCSQIVIDTNIKYLSVTIYPTYTSDNIISNYIFVAEDITVRKNAENALKVANDELENRVNERTLELSNLNNALQKEIYEHKIDEERIKASLKEKEVLLKEIHHRVKNNMQIISSMLGLQSSYVEDKYFNEILKDSQNRIKSMALIHEKLYQSDNMADINFSDYVNTLMINLKNAYWDQNINITADIKNISFNLDIAIPLGLIINELITNSLKHAFPSKKGNISVQINIDNNNYYNLLIKDDGIGLPTDFNLENTKTLGLQLVKVLVEQIDGNLEIINNNGAEFNINFQYKK